MKTNARPLIYPADDSTVIMQELLEALRDMVAGHEDTMRRYGHGCGAVAQARAAIAKAEGRQP